MVSIDLDGIDEATSRGVAELKEELKDVIVEKDWPGTISVGRRGGKSTMAKEALKRLTGLDRSEKSFKKPDTKALMDWNIYEHKEYRRPDGRRFRDSEFDGYLEYLIPDTVLGKSVDGVEVNRHDDRLGSMSMEVNLICDGGIKVNCAYVHSADRPYLMLTGYTEERGYYPTRRLLGSDF